MTTAQSALSRPQHVPLRRILAAAATTVALLAVSLSVAPSSPASAVGFTTVTTPSGLASAFTNGESVILEKSFNVGSGDTSIAVPANGNITLDLNGYVLNVTGKNDEAGIGAPYGTFLTIADRSGGTGALTSFGGQYGAGIGGGFRGTGGTISITGGTIFASGGESATGIGGGYSGDGGSVSITGGTVTAIGNGGGAGIGAGLSGAGGFVSISGGTVIASSDSGAGIGSGNNRDGGTVSITGGAVTATGGYSGAGIGSSAYGDGGSVSITGGTITARGGEYAAGIGGGNSGDGGAVSITGGTVTATGGELSAAIGGGLSGSGGIVSITGGTVTATGGNNGAAIGGGLSGSGGTVSITGGTVTVTGGVNGAAIGGGFAGTGAAVTIGSDAVVTAAGSSHSPALVIGAGLNGASFGSLSNGGTLNIAAGSILVIPVGASVENSGTMNVNGAVNNAGSIVNTGTVIPIANVTGSNFLVTFDDSYLGAPTAVTQRVFASTLTAAQIDLPTPLRVGHTFTNWFNASVDGSVWDADTTIDESLTVYAQWTLDSHTVTFNTNGGSPIDSVDVGYGTTLTPLPTPTRANYAFAGWFLADSAWVDGTAVTGAITLDAHWTLDTHTVLFDSNGGSTIGSVTVDYGTTLTAPTEPTRDGYTFTGWFTDEAATTAFDFATPITARTVLYAGWTKDAVIPTTPETPTPTPTPTPTVAPTTPAPTVSPTPDASLASTGTTDPNGIALGALVTLVLGGGILVLRRRPRHS